VADPLPVVMADDVQLLQLFQNLISNAMKFQNDPQPKIRISVKEESHLYEFSIMDNGIGIDPQNADRIFEMSQRLHSQDEYPGAGIGLATCKKIVERHGGRIWVDSELGNGSTFFFTLPRPSDRDLSVDLEDASLGDTAGEANRLEDET
jgi:light-regulated signal transduction histidine kinase (bacteriophytochrome)